MRRVLSAQSRPVRSLLAGRKVWRLGGLASMIIYLSAIAKSARPASKSWFGRATPWTPQRFMVGVLPTNRLFIDTEQCLLALLTGCRFPMRPSMETVMADRLDAALSAHTSLCLSDACIKMLESLEREALDSKTRAMADRMIERLRKNQRRLYVIYDKNACAVRKNAGATGEQE